MEGEGIVAVDPPLPPHSPEIGAVISAGDEDPAVASPPSDDEDRRPQATASSEEDVRAKIIKQVEYYFGDENLPNDKFLIKHVKKDKEGFVPISLIASFRKMKKLTKDVSLIVAALKDSSQLVLSLDGKKVKRLHALPINESKDPKFCTVVVENLPEDHSVENIKKICGQVGRIKCVSIHDPHAAKAAAQSSKAEKLISGKIYALIEYETVEAAEKAVATLNDETDWRNGLRVQLLRKRMGYNMGRKAWRGSESEKSSHARVSVPVGHEDNGWSNEQQQDDVPDDEGGEQVSKERNGRKGQNQKGRKYRGNNGMGHGSAGVVEAAKPPPGPRMPDGTRGFTMGRGRPVVPSDVLA